MQNQYSASHVYVRQSILILSLIHIYNVYAAVYNVSMDNWQLRFISLLYLDLYVLGDDALIS